MEATAEERLEELEADMHDVARALKIITLAVQVVASSLSDAWLPVEQRERFLAELEQPLPEIAERLASIEQRLES